MQVDALIPSAPVSGVWPGFIIAADDADVPRVVYSSHPADLPKDSRLVSCDGTPFETLLKERVDPYFGNPDIPHMRRFSYNRLFYIPGSDTYRLSRCTFQTPGGNISRNLNWQNVEQAVL